MAISKEEAMAELEKRGVDSSKYVTSKQISRRQALEELKRRNIPIESIQEKILSGGEKSPSFWEGLKKELPELVGGLAGMAGKTSFPGIALSAIGGAGGEAYKQLYQHATGSEEAPQSSLEAAKRIGTAGLRQGGYELGGRAVMGGVQRILAPAGKTFIPEAVAMDKTLRKYGSHLTPAQKTESGMIDTLEEIAEGSFFGRGPIGKFKIGQKEAFGKYVDDAVDSFASGIDSKLSPEEVGTLYQEVFTGQNTAFKKAANVLYSKVDEATQEAMVSLKHLKDFANKTLKIAEQRKGIGSTQAGDTLLKKILSLEDTVTFKEAQAIRSGIGDELSTLSTTKDKAVGLAKQFFKKTDEAMQVGAGGLSGEALETWKRADTFYRAGKERFSNKFIRRLTELSKERPEFVVQNIFRDKAVTQIKRVKNVVDNKTWETLKHSYLEGLMDAAKSSDGELVGKTLLGKLKKMGEPALREIFTPEEIGRIRGIGKMGELIQKTTGGSGKMLIQLTQAPAVVGLGGMFFGQPAITAGATGFIITPYALARMIIHPTWSKWLAEGIRLPSKSPEAAALATKIIGTATKIDRERAERKF
jgi:hypothetical protein